MRGSAVSAPSRYSWTSNRSQPPPTIAHGGRRPLSGKLAGQVICRERTSHGSKQSADADVTPQLAEWTFCHRAICQQASSHDRAGTHQASRTEVTFCGTSGSAGGPVFASGKRVAFPPGFPGERRRHRKPKEPWKCLRQGWASKRKSPGSGGGDFARARAGGNGGNGWRRYICPRGHRRSRRKVGRVAARSNTQKATFPVLNFDPLDLLDLKEGSGGNEDRGRL